MKRADRIKAGIRAGTRTRPSAVKKNGPAPKGRSRSLSPQSWIGKMKDIPCFILGNAPSLNNIEDMSILDNYFTVGINRIFFKYDPTILLWQDLALWSKEKQKVLETKSIKYCREGSNTQGGFYTFFLQGREPKLTNNVTKLYGRGSSGSITYQFVHALGCNPIILVGMDCRYNKKGQTDFYGDNPMHRSHTLPACVKGLQFIKNNSKHKTIINCSRNKVFSERKTIEEAVALLGEKKYNREELVKILNS